MPRKTFYHRSGAIAPAPIKGEDYIIQEIGPRHTIKVSRSSLGYILTIREVSESDDFFKEEDLTLSTGMWADSLVLKDVVDIFLKQFFAEHLHEALYPIIDLILDMGNTLGKIDDARIRSISLERSGCGTIYSGERPTD